jgi:hypothetical protein
MRIPLRRPTLIDLLLVIATALALMPEARAERIFADGFEEGEPGGPVDPCAGLIAPAGWVLELKSWDAAFSSPAAGTVQGAPFATYPNSVGNPVPVPGYRFYSRSGNHKFYLKGQIVAIPFVPPPNLSVTMTWDQAQSGPFYTQPRPARMMFVGISPYPHDLCPRENCSVTGGAGSLHYTTETSNTGLACPLNAGQTYYINVAMADPTDGLQPQEHTCSDTAANSANGCDVQMVHRGTFGVLRSQLSRIP